MDNIPISALGDPDAPWNEKKTNYRCPVCGCEIVNIVQYYPIIFMCLDCMYEAYEIDFMEAYEKFYSWEDTDD